MKQVGKTIRDFSPAQREVLERRLLQRSKGVMPEDAYDIQRRPVSGASVLSFAQQRLWFLDQLEPNSALYNIPKVLRLIGPLNVDALEQAFNVLVARHEVLRTVFREAGGFSEPVICPPARIELQVVDTEESEVSGRIIECLYRPFSLRQWPLVRMEMLRLGRQEHLMVLAIHHIISDGWSMDVLFRELGTFYTSIIQGKEPELGELPIQYMDYAVWQRDRLQGQVLDQQVDYWRRQLAGAPVLEIPTDRPRPRVLDFAGARERFVLPASLVERLNGICQQFGVTRFMAMLAVFQVLLCRLSGQDDIVVGSPIAGRTRRKLEGLIGFFVNTLVLRTDLSGNPGFLDLLDRVREVALGAYAHQELPFEKLVKELQPARYLNRNPFFDVMINSLEESEDSLSIPGVYVHTVEPDRMMAKFALTLYLRSSKNTVSLDMVYQKTLFDASRVRYMGEQFCYLLDQIVADPENRIQSYSLVVPSSSVDLPDPRTRIEKPPQVAVIDAFLEMARQAPERSAVAVGDEVWSYGELAGRSLCAARRLCGLGVGRGDVVAVYGYRSFGLVVGMLAVMRSGGVLLTIDPELPRPRQEFLMREAGAGYVLQVGCDAAGKEMPDTSEGPGVLKLDAQTGAVVDPLPGGTGTDLVDADPVARAYIFFTSGSTGIPKVVVGSHEGLSHFINWQGERFGIGPGDRVAQLTNMSFDVILRDIFLPLTRGGTLCLPRDTDLMDVPAWVERQHITVLHAVPSLVRHWLERPHEGVRLERLRWLFFAGEPLTDSLVSAWRSAFPRSGEIVNLYGATEATLAKCYHILGSDLSSGVQAVGRPLPQAQALVLGHDHRLCGVGERGEIAFRSPFLALGYANAEIESEARFISNPYRGDPHDRIYLTGDEGRYRPDGILEILGRLDDQVKIRGVRIEPAEIAAMLEGHPAVRSCAVSACYDQQAGAYLVAHVVLRAGQSAPPDELRLYLSERLPTAMVPGVYRFIESLPRLANGKLDRDALPEAEPLEDIEGMDGSGPRTRTELELTRLWLKVLERDRLGVHENFFDVGGHSLQATQLVSRINATFGIKLPVRVIFESPTISRLAAHVDDEKTEMVQEEPKIRRVDRDKHRGR